MSSAPTALDRLIWATRGRSWGFRFLLDGGLDDPLREYERMFVGVESRSALEQRGTSAALRFPDPLGRRDTAGRVIPHDFVVPEGLASRMTSVEEGVREVWPMIEDAYARVWDLESAPTEADLRLGD